jgi:hypothetical protein
MNWITEISITALNSIELTGKATNCVWLKGTEFWSLILKSWTIFGGVYIRFHLCIHRKFRRFFLNIITFRCYQDIC